MDISRNFDGFDAKMAALKDFSAAEITRICDSYGGRDCGGENERKAQEDLIDALRPYADSVARETFDVHPEAFMSFVSVAGSMCIGATALNAVGALKKSKAAALGALALTGGALATVAGEFLFYKKVLDPLFPKKQSGNVVAVRKASGETRRRVIISGHTDSAPEWTYTYKFGSRGVLLVGGYAVAGLAYTAVSSVLSLLLRNRRAVALLTAGQALFLPAYGLLFRFVDFKNYVPGASDDLSGSLTAVSVMKFLAENDVRFENTEVVALLTGGEEAGLRGSSAFFEAQKKKKNDGVETVFMGFDTLRDAEYMAIYKGDMSGMVKNDARVCEVLRRSAAEIGHDVPVTTIPLGSTDAAAASRAGIPAAAFVAMDPAPARYYHTRLDTADNVLPETIEKGIRIALNALFDIDENGI